MSSHSKDTKNGVSFFTSMRRLGRDVDHGVRDLTSQLDVRCPKSDNRHLALKGLLDRKKTVESLKVTFFFCVWTKQMNQMPDKGALYMQIISAVCYVKTSVFENFKKVSFCSVIHFSLFHSALMS